MFRAFTPSVWGKYRDMLDSVTSVDRGLGLVRNFANSVFAGIAFNLGPSVYTRPHRDASNLAGGWCSITAFGDFDPTRGGHLILWDLGVALQFPPGCTIFIPSSLLLHSNIPVRDHECRHSMTQFSSGHLWRWVDNGFQLDSKEKSKLAEKERAEEKDLRRRQETLDAFPLV